MFFFFSSRRRHTRCSRDWSSDVCSSDLLSASLGERITRTGTLHPFFAPVAVFQTRDGYVYVAVGNDAQWAALAKLRAFAGLDRPEWAANAGRIADVGRLHRELGERVARLPTAEAQALLREAGDRKSTRLNSSHGYISYAVFCLKKKKTSKQWTRTTWSASRNPSSP